MPLLLSAGPARFCAPGQPDMLEDLIHYEFTRNLVADPTAPYRLHALLVALRVDPARHAAMGAFGRRVLRSMKKRGPRTNGRCWN